MVFRTCGVVGVVVLMAGLLQNVKAVEADLVLRNGQVMTVDPRFAIREAIAITNGRIAAVTREEDIHAFLGPATRVVDLDGRWVLPGLIDSHAHPADACVTEFDHPIPVMERIQDVLDYVRSRASVTPEGEWIQVRQVFITRLQEQRYPTRLELDAAAPRHPVLFQTGPDASLNSLGLQRSGIDRDFKVTDGGSGFAEKDPRTGEPTGILRNCTRYVKATAGAGSRSATVAQRTERLVQLFQDYNAAGITTVADRDAGVDDLDVYRAWRGTGRMTVRVRASHHVESIGSPAAIEAGIRRVARDPLCTEDDPWLRIIGIKAYLDGGMLTGSAYMREPWGVSSIYSITDPAYRGVRFISHDRVVLLVRTALQENLQFTAHAVGDGAVHGLLEAYDEVGRTTSLGAGLACISHSNFMSREAVEMAARLGVMLDVQPVWLYLDSHTLAKQFGLARLRYFQPLRSLFEAGVTAGGGSDHMQKIGSLRSVNPYNPFLGLATAVTRKARRLADPMHPEESLSRIQAIRFYTINNARVLRCERDLGSLEAGKLADMIVVDTDLLQCPEERIASTRVLQTYVGGRRVH